MTLLNLCAIGYNAQGTAAGKDYSKNYPKSLDSVSGRGYAPCVPSGLLSFPLDFSLLVMGDFTQSPFDSNPPGGRKSPGTAGRATPSVRLFLLGFPSSFPLGSPIIHPKGGVRVLTIVQSSIGFGVRFGTSGRGFFAPKPGNLYTLFESI